MFLRLTYFGVMFFTSLSLLAQDFKAERLRKAVEIMDLQIVADSLLPEQTFKLTTKDGRIVSLRTNTMGVVEHIGIPLFDEKMRLLQPSPVYDFLEYAALNKKYKLEANQLNLSKVIFKKGSWETLFNEKLNECGCSIENREDKLYIVTWNKDEKEIAVIGIPIEYELLNNDTRRNMEQTFVRELSEKVDSSFRPTAVEVSERDLSIYGTEGLFVIPGKSYLIDLLNQNVYYKLTTVYEKADTVIRGKSYTLNIETVQPVVVNEPDFPAETMANYMMCDNSSVPDVMLELDFHLSNYHRQLVTMPLSRLKEYCRQQGCSFFFACDGTRKENLRGVMFASNLAKGYNHLFSIRMAKEQILEATPKLQADVYLYIPPISKEKLFGTAPTKKSGANFKLP